MEFGLDKCAVLVMKRGKIVESAGIPMPNQEVMKALKHDDKYKYLGVLEADDIKHEEMKKVIKTEYFRRVRKILNSKLNGKNIITSINSRAVSIIRYSAGVLNWPVAEVKELDRKTRKQLTMHGAHHPKANTDRLYMKRESGGRGLISVEDCIEIESNSLLEYLSESQEPLLQAAHIENVVKVRDEVRSKADIEKGHTEQRKEKNLHGQFEKATEELRGPETWDWLTRGTLKKETESTIIAAQDQAIATNNMRREIFKENISPLCRLCGKSNETISHITSECPTLAQNQYKCWRHDEVARILHWKLCQKWGFESAETWYNHKPECVLENDDCKMLWDFPIQTDKEMEHNKPDITVVDKKNKVTLLIDPTCPFDTRISQKEQEKNTNYNPLKFEVGKIWEQKIVKVVPIAIGALGTVSKNFNRYLKTIEIECPVELLQKAALLGTARIIRYVLSQ